MHKKKEDKKNLALRREHLALVFVFIVLASAIRLDVAKTVTTKASEDFVAIDLYRSYAVDLGAVDQVTLPQARSSDLPPDFAPASYIVIDNESGSVLASKNTDQKRQIASLTKLMTALVVLENGNLDDEVVIVGRYGDLPAHRIGILPGDRISLRDLLAASLITSSNDAAAALSDYLFPGEPRKFIDKMNEKAREIGMFSTNFSNMIGLDQGSNYSTARDLALLSRVVLQKPEIMAVAGLTEKEIIWNGGSKKAQLVSTNKLLIEKEPGVYGLKTGSTPMAGECLIAAQEKDGHSILVVVLGAPARFENTKNILSWVDDNINWR